MVYDFCGTSRARQSSPGQIVRSRGNNGTLVEVGKSTRPWAQALACAAVAILVLNTYASSSICICTRVATCRTAGLCTKLSSAAHILPFVSYNNTIC